MTKEPTCDVCGAVHRYGAGKSGKIGYRTHAEWEASRERGKKYLLYDDDGNIISRTREEFIEEARKIRSSLGLTPDPPSGWKGW